MPSRCLESRDSFLHKPPLDPGNRRVAAGKSRRMLSVEKLLFSKSGYPSSSPPFIMQASPFLTSITRVRNANQHPVFSSSSSFHGWRSSSSSSHKSSRGMHSIITIALVLSPPNPGLFRPEESRTRRPPFSLSRGGNKIKRPLDHSTREPYH